MTVLGVCVCVSLRAVDSRLASQVAIKKKKKFLQDAITICEIKKTGTFSICTDFIIFIRFKVFLNFM